MKLFHLAQEYSKSASQLKERLVELKQLLKKCKPNSQESVSIQNRIYLLHNEYYALMKTAKYLSNYYSKLLVVAVS